MRRIGWNNEISRNAIVRPGKRNHVALAGGYGDRNIYGAAWLASDAVLIQRTRVRNPPSLTLRGSGFELSAVADATKVRGAPSR